MLGEYVAVFVLVNLKSVMCAALHLLPLPGQKEERMWLSMFVSGVSPICGCY